MRVSREGEECYRWHSLGCTLLCSDAMTILKRTYNHGATTSEREGMDGNSALNFIEELLLHFYMTRDGLQGSYDDGATAALKLSW